MSDSQHHPPLIHRHLLDALKCSNIKRLNEILQECDKWILNRKLRYEVDGQQRLFSPILAAVDLSSTSIVKLLISKGADVNKKGFSSNLKDDTQYIYTPLFLACCTGRLDVIALLAEAGAKIDIGAGDKNVREEEGGYLHMEGVYPLLNFSLMYLNSSVCTTLLLVGADPSLSLMSIVQHGYHVDKFSIKTLLQAGALLHVENLDVITYLLDSDVMFWEILEMASCDFTNTLLEYSSSYFRVLLRQYLDKSNNEAMKSETERKKILTGYVPESLKHHCRRCIRKICGNIRLFCSVHKLRLPNELKQFLLFGFDLHKVELKYDIIKRILAGVSIYTRR